MKRFVPIAVVAIAFVPSTSRAECPDAVDQVLVFPRNQANGVPTNVVLRAEFPPTRDPRSAPLWHVLDDHGQRVAGEERWDGATSSFTPAVPLGERRTYTARVTAQATGEFWQISFGTGTAEDLSAPRFGGASSVSWSQRPESWLLETCRLARGDGFLFALDLSEAEDDATPAEDLGYSVYLTEGPGADDDTPIARLRPQGSSVTVMRAVEDGEGEFCFRVEVRDLADRVDGNRREVCAEAIAGAIFDDACATTSPRPRSHEPAPLLVMVGVFGLLLVTRSRR